MPRVRIVDMSLVVTTNNSWSPIHGCSHAVQPTRFRNQGPSMYEGIMPSMPYPLYCLQSPLHNWLGPLRERPQSIKRLQGWTSRQLKVKAQKRSNFTVLSFHFNLHNVRTITASQHGAVSITLLMSHNLIYLTTTLAQKNKERGWQGNLHHALET